MRRLLASEKGAGAAEFALVLPVLLLLLFGIIDGGRLWWEMNQAEKATQMGARMAIVTESLSPGLRDADYADTTVNGVDVDPGDTIPLEALDTILCKQSGCSCVPAGGACPTLGTMNSTAFTSIVNRMALFKPGITAANVEVRYSGSGLGSAGDLITSGGSSGGGSGGTPPPEEMEVAPIVTVSLTGLQFRPITGLLFVTFNLPDFATSLTAEDMSGAYSN